LFAFKKKFIFFFKKMTSKVDEYSDGIAQLAVVQMLEKVGFDGGASRETTLVLTDVAKAYIRQLGVRSRRSANMACRVQVSLDDVVHGALDEMHVDMTDLMIHLAQDDDVPLPIDVLQFPLKRRQRRRRRNKKRRDGECRLEHVPYWLGSISGGNSGGKEEEE
jgi:Bromodomain associated